MLRLPLYDYGLSEELGIKLRWNRPVEVPVNMYDVRSAYDGLKPLARHGGLYAIVSAVEGDPFRKGILSDRTTAVAAWAVLCDALLGQVPLMALAWAVQILRELETRELLFWTRSAAGERLAERLGWIVPVGNRRFRLASSDVESLICKSPRREPVTTDLCGRELLDYIWRNQHEFGAHRDEDCGPPKGDGHRGNRVEGRQEARDNHGSARIACTPG